ncbi:hypothetical protein B0T26DRAFT_713540 [Lasiosphaeria miniovina]|uniref:Wax synthase domain-containing protein n=1 Tax=Lasiosphaeria miniovina TaxID=1954250 RepID=A0AA40E0U6_9PEZI|nr:uncharacterized protein B0T26DRAFT_713540 [Lasiosphaeria miniovina]KAK0718533.1 hypothetical protein B0T26DRAFT_713540 [Lasiosphaeria miniovina]
MLAVQRAVVPAAGRAWDALTLARVAYLEVLMALVVYCGMVMQFDVAAAVGVGLGLSEPEDWPPLFGSLADCYTLANVWGRFWHQYIRQPSLGVSQYLIRTLHVQPHSQLAYFTHLATAFVISDFFHVLSVGSVSPGFLPLSSLVAHMSRFFLVQPLATAAESIVMRLYARHVQPQLLPSSGEQKQTLHDLSGKSDGGKAASVPAVSKSDGSAVPKDVQGQHDTNSERKRKALHALLRASCRIFGYLWVLCWFVVTGWPFVKAYLDVRMADWGLPYSILESACTGRES